MGTELTVLNNQSLETGGIGLGSTLFKLKPATLEIVQRTSRQEGAEPGRFRDTSTNVHYDKMEWVLLMNPVPQRSLFTKGDFSRESKICFSLDNVQPHKLAKEPQAPFCATCSKGSWDRYRKTNDSNDVPPCKEYWHLVIADRQTQMPYYFNVKGLSMSETYKGTSLCTFKQGMQNVARLISAIQANVKAENKTLAAAGATLKPMPNIFDIKFPVSITTQTRPSGISYVLVVGKPVQMNEEARREFGALYLDFANRKAAGNVQSAEESEAAADLVAEAPARSEVAAVVGPVVGEVLPPKSDITI